MTAVSGSHLRRRHTLGQGVTEGRARQQMEGAESMGDGSADRREAAVGRDNP
jgi:hypothetical protein